MEPGLRQERLVSGNDDPTGAVVTGIGGREAWVTRSAALFSVKRMRQA